MVYLAQFLVSAFGSLIAFFAQWVTKKTALGLAVVAIFTTLTAALFLAIKGLVLGLAATITHKWILIGMSALWPPNAEACIAAIIAGEAAIFLYRTHIENIKAISYIT